MKNEFHMIFITKSWDAKFMISIITICHLKSWEWHAPKGFTQGIMVNFSIQCVAKDLKILFMCAIEFYTSKKIM